jgi:APA family basic amino acid/polyamine antiporter
MAFFSFAILFLSYQTIRNYSTDPCGAWLLYFFGANLVPASWFGPFSFDSSELPIVTLYAMYIPIFIVMMNKEKDLNFFRRYLMPFLAICACIFMVIAACYAHGMAVLYYLIIFAVIMALGLILNHQRYVTTVKSYNN